VGLDDVRKAVASDPSRVGLFSDLDGTLAEIIDDPESVVPISGVTDRMAQLADQLGIVAVVSGRPVSFLERFFSSPIELSGLYGLEHRAAGRLLVDSVALEWLPVMALTADRARERFGSESVEDKRYSLTIHYRGATEERAAEIVDWVEQVANETGLDAGVAKMSVELHPPTDRSKGDAVHDMLGGIDVAVYLGDDVGDIPAFERLESLSTAGVLRAYAIVLVESAETAPILREFATNTVGSPGEIIEVLDVLVDAASSSHE